MGTTLMTRYSTRTHPKGLDLGFIDKTNKYKRRWDSEDDQSGERMKDEERRSGG